MTCVGGQPFGLQALFTNQCVDGFCEASLWHVPDDDPCIPSQRVGLDANGDAMVQAAYMPTGSLSIRIVSRGQTAFANAFAWYNVTGSSPGMSDIHTVVNCYAGAGTTVVLDIASDPNYLGGAVGFVLVTPESHGVHGSCASGDCCASVSRVMSEEGFCYYTDRNFNPDNGGLGSWIHCLTYKSITVGNRYYLAWDDRYGGGDNDFMDLVLAVDGVVPAP